MLSPTPTYVDDIFILTQSSEEAVIVAYLIRNNIDEYINNLH